MRNQFHRKATIMILLIACAWAFIEWVGPLLNSESLRRVITELEYLGPFAIIGYVIVSHVIAPLGGIPALIVGTAIYGIEQTMLYIYIASMISAVINFYISKKYGRGFVSRLIGQRIMREVDEFSHRSGIQVLVIARIFGIAFFEEISYAAGLTHMSFRTYMVITILASIIPHAVIAYLFGDIDPSNMYELGGLLALVIGVCLLSLILLRRLHTASRKKLSP